MTRKRSSINLDTKPQLKNYFTFFPPDLNEFIEKNMSSHEIKCEIPISGDDRGDLNFLALGFGAACMELPLIIKLSYTFNININVLAVDKSYKQRQFFIKLIELLNQDGNIVKEQIINSKDSNSIWNNLDLKEPSNIADEEDVVLILPNKKRISFTYLVKNLEFDPKINDLIDYSQPLIEELVIRKFNGEKFDFICLSFILNHLHYWRSLISYLNFFLKENGKFLISEVSGDNILINGDLLRWSIENANELYKSDGTFKLEEKEMLYNFFDRFYPKKFAVISENNEISAINIDVVRQFFGFFSKAKESMLEVNYQPFKCNLGTFKSMIKNGIFSIFIENIKYVELSDEGRKGIQDLLKDDSFRDHMPITFEFKLKWWVFPKIVSQKIEHFNLMSKKSSQFNFLGSLKGQYVGEFKQLIRNSLDVMLKQKNMIFEIDFFGRQMKKNVIENKIDDIIYYFRRFLPFDENVASVNVYIDYPGGNKSYIIPSDFIASSGTRSTIFKKINLYFEMLRAEYKSKTVINQFTNLNYFYNKFKSKFNKPFILNYTLRQNPSLSKKSELCIDVTRCTGFYEVNISYIKRKNGIKIKLGKDVIRFLKPKKEEYESIIESLNIVLDIFGESHTAIIPLFRNSITDDKTITLKNIGAATLLFNSPPNWHEKEFYIWLLENMISSMNLDAIVDFIEYQDMLIREAKKSATSAVMTRNMSHNIGSHVLSSLSLGDIETRKYDIAKFNAYLQQRMDFLARVSTEWPTTGEYLCFYSDVMRNFLKQSLLLDRIIKDDGVAGDKIKIHLKINSSEPITFSQWPFPRKNGGHEYDFIAKKEDGFNLKDMLVHLPGGMLGTQAFYVILENIMRNSAKYSKSKGDDYDLYIDISDNNDHSYKVQVYDNFSVNRGDEEFKKRYQVGSLLELLQEKLDRPLIKETGEITKKDWGIQEIKIAAQFLNYPYREPDNPEPGQRTDAGGSKNYVWVDKKELPIGNSKDIESTEQEKVISYLLTIPKARLVMCVDHSNLKELDKLEAHQKGVLTSNFSNFLTDLEKLPVEMLYFEIKDDEREKFKTFLSILQTHYNFLPARIVVGAPQELIEKLHKDLKASSVHPRRLVICPRQKTKVDGSVEAFIISVYKQWVFRWHKKKLMDVPGEGAKEKQITGDSKNGPDDSDKNVGIVIYFERDKDFAGFERWKQLQKDLEKTGFNLGNIKFSFHCKDGHLKKESDFGPDDWKKANIGAIMGFDNHGKIWKKYKPWGFYQVIGHDSSSLEMNNHSIFNLLQDVPVGFAGGMFVLSLIESAFTKVVVADERVANWAFEENTRKIFEFKHEGLIPLRILNTNLYISASVHVGKNRHNLIGKDKETNLKIVGENEGVLEGISEKSTVCLKTEDVLEPVEDLDVLIIHLGFLDEIFTETDKVVREDWLKAIQKRIPRIVMVSGRGYKPEEIPLKLPFREASLVTNYISTDFSKLNLVKGILSPRGVKSKADE